MTTIRRDVLKGMVKSGKMEASSCNLANNFTDSPYLPARIKAGIEDFKEGYMNLSEADFKSNVGYADKNPDGSYLLAVHSNQWFSLRARQGT